MQNNNYLPKLHEEIMLIMDEIVRVCEENRIKYYMIGGTLLGAVRHKGFIPWDDDLDICMPREDFNKFISICPFALSSSFELKWITTDNLYWLLFAKVCLKNTLFDQREYSKAGKSFGIFVDIFPIDESLGYRKKLETRKKILIKLSNMCEAKRGASSMHWCKKIISNLFPNIFLYRIIEWLSTLDKDGKLEYYTNYGSQRTVKRQTIRKEYYGSGIMLPFEERVYRAPSNYDAVLRSIFGDGYMNLPPKEKRRSHYPIRILFRDGELMEFN